MARADSSSEGAQIIVFKVKVDGNNHCRKLRGFHFTFTHMEGEIRDVKTPEQCV